jgi:hypothetical protein
MQKLFIFLAIIAGGFVLAGCSDEDKANVSNTVTEKVSDTVQEKFTGTLEEALEKGISQKCTYEYENINGTTYMSGSKIRTENTTTESGSETKTIIIMDDEWTYMWNPSTKEGMKSKNVSEDEQGDEYDNEYSDSDEEEGIDTDFLDSEYELNCGSWKADSSYFEVPSDVTFADLSQLSNDLEDGSVDNLEDLCNLLSGEDKEACLKGF